MNTATKEALVETDLDLDARKARGIELRIADPVYLVDDGYQQIGHVASPTMGAGVYVSWPGGKHGLHVSADLVLVAS